MKRTPNYNLPYAESDDYMRQFPDSVSRQLAMSVDAALNDVKWPQGDIANPDANEITDPGVYFVYASSQSQNLPEKLNGTLTVTGHTNYLVQHYQAWAVGILRSWVRRRTSAGVWENWQSITWRQNNLNAGADLNDVQTVGLYSAAATVANWPDGSPGVLEVLPFGVYLFQRFTSSQNKVYTRTLGSAGWSAWSRLARGEEADSLASRVSVLEDSSDVGESLPIRKGEHDMRVEAIRSRVGQVKADGKAIVALVCDHGSAAFESIILPKLRAHNMKSTLAMCSTQLTLEAGEVAEWSTVSGWADNDKVEIACHSKTHKDVAGPGALVEEIITARDVLAENIGRPVDSWAQPGARNVITPGEAWDGFMDGQGAARYLTTAGELIWNGYGMATGGVPRPGSQAASHVYPLTGRPPLGAVRRFIDGGTADATIAQNIVNHAITNGGRCIVSMHPNYIGKAGYQTKAEAEAFIDWLAARAAAGEIKLVQLREWAIAEN